MIFLGAGASAPFGINTSKELTNLIRRKIETKNSGLLSDIDNFYKEIEPDFETMLTQLTAYTDPTQVDLNHQSLSFAGIYPEYKDDYSILIDEMYKEVCITCTSSFIQGTSKYLEPEKLEEVFTTTYDALFGMPLKKFGRRILVFSTNYDPSIEIWCQKRNMQLIDGTASIENPEIKRVILSDVHIKAVTGQTDTNAIGLVRLHGSIWTYNRSGDNGYYKFTRTEDRLMFPDLYQQIRKKHPSIIFPGQEDKLRVGRWDRYYQFFKSNLKGACLFIGYSFRHTVINEQIISNLETSNLTKLGVLAPDPDKLLSNLFRGRKIPEDKIVRLKGYFGEENGLKELNRKWFPEYYGQTFPTDTGMLKSIRQWQKEKKSLYL